MFSWVRFGLFSVCQSTLAILLLATAARAELSQPKPLSVVATVGMVGDLVSRIGGEAVDVSTIIGNGGDPHLYKASPRDVLLIAKADVIFSGGLLLEGKMAEILERYSKKKPYLAVSETIKSERLLTGAEGTDHHDPHVWMDVLLWRDTVDAISGLLSQQRPESRAAFLEQAEQLKAELADLDTYIRELIQTIPPSQRVLVTAHDAFRYFGRAYAIEVRGIQGISTESEAGLKDINNLVDFLTERKIKAVFVETSVAEKNVLALLEGTAARGHAVKVGGTLYSDALGAPGTYEGTYLGMLESNANTIAQALGGVVPEGGFKMWRAAKPKSKS